MISVYVHRTTVCAGMLRPSREARNGSESIKRTKRHFKALSCKCCVSTEKRSLTGNISTGEAINNALPVA